MRKFLYILLGFIMSCLSIVSAQEHKSVDRIIAVVGRNIILQSELDEQLVQYIYQGEKVDDKFKCLLLQQMLTQKLLKQQADIDSVVVDESRVSQEVDRRMRGMLARAEGDEERLEEFLGMSLIQYKEQMRPSVKEILTAQDMQSKINENIDVTPAEVRDFYKSIEKDSLKRYGTEVEVGNIEMYPELTRDEKQIYRDKIEALRLRVKSGESFSTLAKLYSEDPGSAANGGEYSFVDNKQFTKEYTSWAFKLKKGELSPIFETEFGYHFLEVLDRRGELVKTRHILVVPKPTESSTKRLERRADSLYNKLVAHKIPFSTAAREYSGNNETKDMGGMMYYGEGNGLPTTYIPLDKIDVNIFPIVDTLKVGEFSRPLPFTSPQGKNGFRIFYLKNKVGPHLANLEQDYPKIKEQALAYKMEKNVKKWFDDKRKQTFIKIAPDFQICSELSEWLETSNKYTNTAKID